MPVTSSSSLAAAMASHIQQTRAAAAPRPETKSASFASNLEDLSARPRERAALPPRREAPNATADPHANRPPPPGSLIDIRV
jgi:hypothetical protein